MGIECGRKRDAAEVGGLSGRELGERAVQPGRSQGLQGGEERSGATSRLGTRQKSAGRGEARGVFRNGI
jgi:hypothetical protein